MRKEEEGSSFGCQEKNFFPPEKKKEIRWGTPKNKIIKGGGPQYIVVQIWQVTSWHRTHSTRMKRVAKESGSDSAISVLHLRSRTPKTIKKEQSLF
jgi:hypothetical protein